MARKILFVDNDERVLQGLKRLLHSQSREWEMTFVTSSRAALEMLDQEPFDVVVTDLRLAEIDGIQLLDTIKKRHSQVIRIVLSGESDQEWIMKSVRVSHQFLFRPCTPEVLKATINRNCMLLDLMQDTTLKQVVSRMESLPSLPTLYAEIMDTLNSPDASIKKIGEIVSKDLAMTAKILQLVNSAFFGFPRHISNPAQAAVLLGLNTVKSLVLSIQIFSQFDTKLLPESFLEDLWQHNILIGDWSKGIAEEEGQEKTIVDHAYMAGLLHDTGKLVLAANFPEDYSRVINLSERQKASLHEVENEVFGVSHSEVGAYLMGLWGLPIPIIEALALHHKPGLSVACEFSPLTAVHIANALKEGSTEEASQKPPPVDTDYLTALGLQKRLPVWQKICVKRNMKEDADEAQSAVCR